MEIVGILKEKGEIQQVSEKFKKREFVLTDNSSKYPQHISFQLNNDACSLVDPYKLGEGMKVYFNLTGREWTNPQGQVKYFNSLQAWKIDRANTTAQPSNNDPDNDLPF
jgi:hypothetical protein